MAVLWSIVSVAFSLLLTPFLMFLLSIIFLASIGKSLGVRRLYIKLLLALFEYGRQNIEHVRKRNGNWTVEGYDSDDEDGELPNITEGNATVGFCKNEKKNQNGAIGNSVIARSKDLILVPEPEMQNHNEDSELTNEAAKEKNNFHLEASKEADISRKKSFETLKREFEPAICLGYIRAGIEAIIEDDVTSRFEAEELKNWNLLTRTNRRYEFISWKLTVIWMCGFFMRYCFLLPLRILICFVGVMWLTFCTAIVGYVPDGPFKCWLNQRVLIMCFAVLSSALSSVITYHNSKNRPKTGICVANHTSPIDALVLMCDNCYSLIGQRHGGFLGILQRALARASPHIWFERSEVKDREAVTKRLKMHISDPKNPPILIFPEGTCINNTSVMQFKKGSFEVGGVIYPVAIKYDPRFGDAFWNSNRFSMLQYLYMMMSSWAIVCDVWYLPPMYRREDESAIDFANRVKSVIARQGGLVDLQWDGQLKRMKPKKEWREKQQEEFSKRLKVE
ncbi:PREDICTED: glycerol-3-phosphate acyltransferase 3 isoform X2 [Ceratosolen solmsi marchali]|uniref:Glycerol-3-phosphate acyltransferase 3 isoform X2 n=1 Tax=Ceratosolen solmsi marchali TaxID=326594 RepID=A0AAJ7DUE2_9HYME|nr:PREDICTED: glycerol-3-phosphate acyltransferase 3 isoform X2 [Ceratosolen solmsi marchali]